MTISESVNNRQEGLVSAQKRLQCLWSSFVTNIREINLSCYEFKFVQPNPSGTSYESSLSTASLGFEQKQRITLGLMSKKRMTGYLNKTSSNTMEEINCFETCKKAGSISKIYLLKGDELENSSSFSGKVFKFPGHVHTIMIHQTQIFQLKPIYFYRTYF